MYCFFILFFLFDCIAYYCKFFKLPHEDLTFIIVIIKIGGSWASHINALIEKSIFDHSSFEKEKWVVGAWKVFSRLVLMFNTSRITIWSEWVFEFNLRKEIWCVRENDIILWSWEKLIFLRAGKSQSVNECTHAKGRSRFFEEREIIIGGEGRRSREGLIL